MIFSEKHIKIMRIIILCYIVFAGCFTFPIRSEGKYFLDFMKLYLLVASYGIIGTSLAGLFGKNKGRLVYTVTLAFTVIGLVCRYMLEFGEVSNTYNFTPENIIEYLLIVPIAVLIVYFVAVKRTNCKEN